VKVWTPVARDAQGDRLTQLKDIQDYLMERHLAGYQEYLSAPKGIGEEPVAEWQWRQLPSHARARWMGSRPVSDFDVDDYDRPIIIPGDYVRRKGGQHAFGVEAITEASFMGREGEVIERLVAGGEMVICANLGAVKLESTGADHLETD
jgi:hypothetical protein